MARVTKGRIVRGDAGARAAAEQRGAQTMHDARRARIVPASVMSAHDERERILRAAREEARAIVDSVRAELAQEAEARIAATLLEAKRAEERAADRDRERVIDTAVVLAERIVGAALGVTPEHIVTMAEATLREARGARSLTIAANPLDAAALRAQLERMGLPEGAVSIELADDLARGDLVLKTNLGTIDARLKPQLERLAEALSRSRRAE